MIEALAIADDLTGALEAGAAFAEARVSCVVRTASDLITRKTALAINTTSRHLPASEAFSRVERLATEARERRVRWIYKKTDSTLRGNISSELAAMMNAWPGYSLLYAPAYPRLGRTVRGGRLYVEDVPVERTCFSHDPHSPTTTSSIPDLLQVAYAGRMIPVARNQPLSENPLPAIYVCDGETDADLERRARECARRNALMAAGPAGFLKEWARALPLARDAGGRKPIARTGLIVNGSLHPRSREQVRRFDRSWPVLATPDERAQDSSETSRRLAMDAVAALRRHQPEVLIVFGGETAGAILQPL